MNIANERPFAGLVVRLGLLLAAYALLEWWVIGVSRLEPSAYGEPILLAEVARRLFLPGEGASTLGFAARLGLFVAVSTVAIAGRDRVWIRWRDVEDGAVLQVVVGMAAALLAWAYATYPFNFVADRWHAFDRLLLVASALWTIRRPIFALPTALLAATVVGQFHHPIGGFSVGPPFMLLRILILASAWILVRSVRRDLRPSDLVYAVLTLVASGYVASGIGKLRLGWFVQGGVGFLLSDARADGWLAGADAGILDAGGRWLLRLDPLLLAGTFVVECLGVFALLRRKVLMAFLLVWMGFHGAVFAMSGIFFWMWVIVEGALLALLVVRSRSPALAVFTPSHAIASVPLILGGTIWFHPVNLTWYNVPVTYAYRFEAVTADGERLPLTPADFAPFEYPFALGGFAYLSPDSVLYDTWGPGSPREGALAAARVRSPDEIAQVVREWGRVPYAPARVAAMTGFLARYGAYLNRLRRRVRPVWRGWAPALVHRPRIASSDGPWVPVRRMVVRRSTVLFDGRRYRDYDSRVLVSVEVPDSVDDP